MKMKMKEQIMETSKSEKSYDLPLKKLDNFQIFTSQDFSDKIRDNGQKYHIYRRTLWHFNSMFGTSLSASSSYQRFSQWKLKNLKIV